MTRYCLECGIEIPESWHSEYCEHCLNDLACIFTLVDEEIWNN
jgi:hypothetical protein